MPHSPQTPSPTPATPTLEFLTTAPVAHRIDWRQPAPTLEAFVRNLDARQRARQQYQQPASPATASIHAIPIAVRSARAGGTVSSYPAGTITRCDDELWVQTGRGHLAIDLIEVDGQTLPAAPYFTAAGFTPGDAFDTSHHWTSPSRQFRPAA